VSWEKNWEERKMLLWKQNIEEGRLGMVGEAEI
jgi:hypothetical protein